MARRRCCGGTATRVGWRRCWPRGSPSGHCPGKTPSRSSTTPSAGRCCGAASPTRPCRWIPEPPRRSCCCSGCPCPESATSPSTSSSLAAPAASSPPAGTRCCCHCGSSTCCNDSLTRHRLGPASPTPTPRHDNAGCSPASPQGGRRAGPASSSSCAPTASTLGRPATGRLSPWPPTAAEQDRKHPQVQPVDQIVAQQRLHEVPAADDVHPAELPLEPRHRLGHVTLEQLGVGPPHRVQRPRGDVLGRAVQPGRDRVLGRLLGPVGREDLIGLAAEQQRLQARDVVADDLPRLLVEIGRLPAAVLESPLT